MWIGAGRREVRAAQALELLEALGREVGGVAEPSPPRACELRAELDLGPPHGVDRVAGELHDVEAIEGGLRPRRRLRGAALESRAHVHAEIAHCSGGAAVRLQIGREVVEHLVSAAVADEQHTRRALQHAVLSAVCGLEEARDVGEVLRKARLVHDHVRDLAHVHPLAGVLDVPGDPAPQPLVGHTQEAGVGATPLRRTVALPSSDPIRRRDRVGIRC